MMRRIAGSSLQSRVVVVAIAAVMMFFGIARLRDMPVDVFPEFGAQQVSDFKFIGFHFFSKARAMTSSYRVA